MATSEQTFALTDNDYKIYTYNLFALAKREVANNGDNDIEHGRFDGICGIGAWHISVDVDGKIFPCYRLSGIEDFLMGDVVKTGFNLSVPSKLVALYNIELDNKCSTCFGKVFCKKGCYANKLLTKSDACNSLEKQIGEFFSVENLVNTNAHMLLPVI